MLTINVITLFPEVFEKYTEMLPFKRAIENNELKINLVNLRDFAVDQRGSVDDKPYGGGVGMVIRIEPVYNALQSLTNAGKVILLTPKGTRFTQKKAVSLQEEDVVTLICGRYEGIDARIDDYIDEKVSIGDFVLSGGELPALVVMEAITRLIPNVLESEATTKESFMTDYLEHPQYTRPEEFKGKKVPEELLSGDHKKIENWKKENSTRI